MLIVHDNVAVSLLLLTPVKTGGVIGKFIATGFDSWDSVVPLRDVT